MSSHTEKTLFADKFAEGKAACKTAQQRMLALMVERFPKCFFPINEQPKPLKIGIKFDLSAPLQNELKDEQFRKDLWTFFKWYVRRKPYQKALVADNALRVDLEGNEVMAVTGQDKRHAKTRLDEMLKTDEAHKSFAKPKEAMTTKPQLKPEKVNKPAVESIPNLNLLKPKLTLKKKVTV